MIWLWLDRLTIGYFPPNLSWFSARERYVVELVEPELNEPTKPQHRYTLRSTMDILRLYPLELHLIRRQLSAIF